MLLAARPPRHTHTPLVPPLKHTHTLPPPPPPLPRPPATDFFEAFKSYDEAGSPRRLACLKYLVLASMLMESKAREGEGEGGHAHALVWGGGCV